MRSIFLLLLLFFYLGCYLGMQGPAGFQAVTAINSALLPAGAQSGTFLSGGVADVSGWLTYQARASCPPPAGGGPCGSLADCGPRVPGLGFYPGLGCPGGVIPRRMLPS